MQVILLMLIAYSTVIYALTDGIPRYLMPTIFCYSALAAVGYENVFRGSNTLFRSRK